MDADSELVHNIIGAAANLHGCTQDHGLLNGEESTVGTEAGYQGIEKREEATDTPPASGDALR